MPEADRLGTVDRFQGQEAAVVLISMVTSSGDDLSRQIEFLYSRHRLNVAIFERHLGPTVASPRLLETPRHGLPSNPDAAKATGSVLADFAQKATD